MNRSNYENLFHHLKIENHVEVIKLLPKCDLDNFDALCHLQDWNFVNDCHRFYCKTSKELSPGRLVLIQSIGKNVSELSEDDFYTIIEPVPVRDENKYPFLDLLNQQKNEYKCNETLLDMSTYIRIKDGRQLHQVLSTNLPLPSTSTVDNIIQKMDYVGEGEIQVSFLCLTYPQIKQE